MYYKGKKVVFNMEELVKCSTEGYTGNRTLEIELEDFLYVYRTIEELRRFFHNQDHYKKLSDVNDYMDPDNGRMFSILNRCYIKCLDKLLTEEIEELMENDKNNPDVVPFYYLPDNHEEL